MPAHLGVARGAISPKAFSMRPGKKKRHFEIYLRLFVVYGLQDRRVKDDEDPIPGGLFTGRNF
jgi:hypothetical protein